MNGRGAWVALPSENSEAREPVDVGVEPVHEIPIPAWLVRSVESRIVERQRTKLRSSSLCGGDQSQWQLGPVAACLTAPLVPLKLKVPVVDEDAG